MADIDRVLRALNHPIRRQILAAIAEEPRSSSSLAKEFKMELSSVAYHLNQVLYKECDVVEMVEATPRRGALEKFFRIKVDAFSEGDGEEPTLEEQVLALVVGIAPPRELCSSPGTGD